MQDEIKRSPLSLADMPTAMPNGMPSWMHQMREAARAVIRKEDIEAIVKGQVEKAKAGDRGAIRFIFDQVLGGGAFKGATFIQNNIETCVGLPSEDSPRLLGAPDPRKPIRQGASVEERMAMTKARLEMGLPLTNAKDSANLSLE